MIKLSDIDKKREERLLKGINFFKTACNDDTLKIIVSDLGIRLHNKLREVGEISDDCYTDIDLAVQEYLRRKDIEEYPKVSFISPSITKGFGEEEMSKIFCFYEKLGVNKYDFDFIKKYKKFIISMCLKTPYCSDGKSFIPLIFQYRIACISVLKNEEVINFNMDINRYISGVYYYDGNNVKLTSDNIYGLTKYNSFLLNIYKDYITNEKKINKEKMIRYASLGGFVKEELYTKEFINIYPKNEEEQRQLNTLVQYGYLTSNKKENNKYYINSLTCLIFPTILSNYTHELSSYLVRIIQLYHYYGPKEIIKFFESYGYSTLKQNNIVSKQEMNEIKEYINNLIILGSEYNKMRNRNSNHFPSEILEYLGIFLRDYMTIGDKNKLKEKELIESSKRKIRQLGK